MDKVNKNSLIPMMEGWFKGFPKLPAGFVDFLVMIAPWLALVFGIMGILGSIAAFGFLGMVGPYAMMYGASRAGLWYVAVIGGLIASVFTLLAFPGLRDKKTNGWTMLFWAQVISVASSVVGINVGGIVGALIGLYILFQMKLRYKQDL